MGAIEDQITEIEDEIRRTPHNKATEGHIGKLRAKIAALKIEREKRAKGGGGGLGYAVRKSGHATVALVGYPSVGKSTLLTRITGAQSEAAAYEFTTTTIIPGMLIWRGARIQILDMPGLIRGAYMGRGRGREVIGVARSSDLVIFVIDPQHLDFRGLSNELEGAGIRVNKRPPSISVTRMEKGGVQIESTVRLTKVTPELATDIVRQFGIHNALVIFRENAAIDDLIDVIAGNRVYIPAILAVNKCDLMTREMRKEVTEKLAGGKPLFASASTGEGIEALTDAIGEALAFVRIYLKPPGKAADMKEPLILRRGSTVRQLLERLPEEMTTAFLAAQVWGKSARFPGQRIGLGHILQDQDVVSVIVKRG